MTDTYDKRFEITNYIEAMDQAYDLLKDNPKGLYKQDLLDQLDHPKGVEALDDLLEAGIVQENRRKTKVRLRVKKKAISIEPLEDGEGCRHCPIWADYLITTERGTFPYCADCRYSIFE